MFALLAAALAALFVATYWLLHSTLNMPIWLSVINCIGSLAVTAAVEGYVRCRRRAGQARRRAHARPTNTGGTP